MNIMVPTILQSNDKDLLRCCIKRMNLYLFKWPRCTKSDLGAIVPHFSHLSFFYSQPSPSLIHSFSIPSNYFLFCLDFFLCRYRSSNAFLFIPHLVYLFRFPNFISFLFVSFLNFSWSHFLPFFPLSIPSFTFTSPFPYFHSLSLSLYHCFFCHYLISFPFIFSFFPFSLSIQFSFLFSSSPFSFTFSPPYFILIFLTEVTHLPTGILCRRGRGKMLHPHKPPLETPLYIYLSTSPFSLSFSLHPCHPRYLTEKKNRWIFFVSHRSFIPQIIYRVCYSFVIA